MFSFLSGPFAAFGKALGAGAVPGADAGVAEGLKASMGQAASDYAKSIDQMGRGVQSFAADPVGSAQGYMNDQFKNYMAQATGRAPMPAQPQGQPPAMPAMPGMPAPQVVQPQPRQGSMQAQMRGIQSQMPGMQGQARGMQAQMPGYFRRPMIPGLFDR